MICYFIANVISAGPTTNLTTFSNLKNSLYFSNLLKLIHFALNVLFCIVACTSQLLAFNFKAFKKMLFPCLCDLEGPINPFPYYPINLLFWLISLKKFISHFSRLTARSPDFVNFFIYLFLLPTS